MGTTDHNWPLRLFGKSVLKQRKFKEITALLGETGRLHCLDIGADNGVISYLLRKRGGAWKSADLDAPSVAAIRELVKTDVYQLDGQGTPFRDGEFDRIAIVDFLEHIPAENEFIGEMFRIMKPGGILILNVPHLKNGLLRRFRLAIGQTDEKHGHLRPGYTVESVTHVLGERFAVETHKTYSKFFSELVDTLIVAALDVLKKGRGEQSKKGLLMTAGDMKKFKKIFRLYTCLYPVVKTLSYLDGLLYFTSGYMLIVKARVNKEAAR